jgi:hypothetical protein
MRHPTLRWAIFASLVLATLVGCGPVPASDPVGAPSVTESTAQPAPAEPVRLPSIPLGRAVVAEASPTPPPPPAPAPAQAPRSTTPTVSTVRLNPVTALADQDILDQGHLVTWWVYPPCVVAGHDTDGWDWLANIPSGTTVEITRGPCAGTYRVEAHHWSPNRGGPMPDALLGWDLALQTCVRSGGTGFSLARRI